MGNLVWNQYSRFVSITASVCECHRILLQFKGCFLPLSDAVWASFFGFFYRKFFWDFVGGTLRDPGGLQYVLLRSSHPLSYLNPSIDQQRVLPFS
ncbi:hypothetical protein CPB84DRAFT_1773018 [Gymnopilus junonius]|uniref:DUF7727 domain-containing protein n=1 Tax=Gymnopilus junonius TaxID=109634 RepID=A0A9P5NPJ0_GYMJU|nr:hypothetical protein CPB84DRAFT_1773018 [Gymnopilus junonius]